MGVSPELEERIRKHDENRNFKNSKPDWIDKSAEQQKKFVSSYPKDLIRKIKIDNYVSGKKLKNGKPDKNTFTYLLEFESTDFGTIGGTPMSKYVVGVNKKTQEYTLGNLEKGFKSHSEAFKKTINLIADCVDAAGEFDKDKDWKKLSDTIAEKIESQKYTPSIVVITKIIAMYYPENFPYIWSHPYLNKTLNLFEIDHSDLPKKSKKGKFYEKMKRLVDAKNSHPIMNEWDNEFFRELITEMITGKSSQPAQNYSSEESNSEFKKIKRVCMEEFPKSVRNYREVTIKTLLESPGFTAERAKILENIDKLNFGRGHGTAPEMIREYLDIKFNIVEINGSTYSLLLSPNTSSEQVNELLKICGQTIAKYHIKKMTEKDVE